MAQRYLIARQWEDFAHAVSLEQRQTQEIREVKRAFYAGCHGLLNAISDALDEPGAEPDFGLMDHINAEIQDFAKDVMEDRA
jgi:hypothetical protein